MDTVTVIPLPSVPTVITGTIPTPARHTGTMVRRGLTVDYLSEPDRGSVAVMAFVAATAGFTAIAAATAIGADTAAALGVDTGAVTAAERSVADSAAVVTRLAADSMAVVVVDSAAAAVAMVAAATGNRQS
jgi:hypothetical protein